jgi:hypothetical protein
VIVAFLLLAFVTGCAIAGVRPCRHAALRVSLGLGIGIGVASLCFFVSLVTGLPDIALELVVLAAAAALWWMRRAQPCALCKLESTLPRTGFERIFAAVFVVAAIGAAIAFWMETSHSPGGGWDAWAIWNLRARFLFRGGAHWRDGFSQLLFFSHPDYPLLVSGFIARGWRLAGQEIWWIPALTAFVFTLSAPVLLASTLSVVRGRAAGWLAGLFLLGTPYFILHGASQFADVPTAFFMLATVLLLALCDLLPESREFAVLAGLCAGLTAWTKNEGLLFRVVVIAVWVAAILLSGKAARLRRDLPMFLMGMAPTVPVIFYFRQTLATENYFLGADGPGTRMQRVLDLSRYLTVVKAFAVHIWDFGQLFLTPFLFLALYLWLAGPDVASRRTSVYTAFGCLTAMVLGYAAVYVISPGDLQWLLGTSLDRLLLQVWPLAIAATFLTARPPRV